MLSFVLCGVVAVLAFTLKATREDLAGVRDEMRREVKKLRARVDKTLEDRAALPTTPRGGEADAPEPAPQVDALPRREEAVGRVETPEDAQEEADDDVRDDVRARGQEVEPDAGVVEPGDAAALPWQMVSEPADETATQAADTDNTPDGPDASEPAAPRVRGLE